MTILEEIVEQTVYDLKKRMRRVTFRDLESMEQYERERRAFGPALRDGKPISVIAEIKKASPSKGEIRPDFNPPEIAEAYQRGGAGAISVLTDEPAFQGSLEYMKQAAEVTSIPILRKDFIVDPYQVKEARAYGADAVLLIASITEGLQMQELLHAAKEFGLQCLVECYTREEVKNLNYELIDILGVNNRDLNTFEVDVHRGIELLHLAPEGTALVSESGLGTPEDLKLLFDEGIHAALIGEHFMRLADPGAGVSEMIEGLNRLIDNEGGKGQNKQKP